MSNSRERVFISSVVAAAHFPNTSVHKALHVVVVAAAVELCTVELAALCSEIEFQQIAAAVKL